MGANAAGVCNMLITIGFSQAAAARITDEQDIDSINEIRILADSDVENLCKVVHHPGGTVDNPVAGQPPIPDTREQMSPQAENNMLVCYWLRHRVHVSRDTVANDITLDPSARFVT